MKSREFYEQRGAHYDKLPQPSRVRLSVDSFPIGYVLAQQRESANYPTVFPAAIPSFASRVPVIESRGGLIILEEALV